MSAAPVIDPLRPDFRWTSEAVRPEIARRCGHSRPGNSGLPALRLRAYSARAIAPASSARHTGHHRDARALADRERSLHSIQTGAIMEYSAADGHHFRTHEEIALARPASMRVEAVAPFGATMVLAANDAGRLTIFDPSKNVLMSGSANAATLERFVRIPLAAAGSGRSAYGPRTRSRLNCRAARLGQR